MKHIHRRFTVDQVKLLLSAYLKRRITREEVEQELGIGKTRFFAILKRYRQNPDSFSFGYYRHTPTRLTYQTECAIQDGLRFDKQLIENPAIPITAYNYSALRDRLREKQGINVSVKTIINRARVLGCYQAKKPKKVHDREVVTTTIGALIQHDTSFHQWSPYVEVKWPLVTSLDDFSRKILYADFLEQETTWAHIEAARILMEEYGIPLRYYVDQLRIFRFIQRRDSIWRKHILQTDDIDPQWRQMMRVAGIDVIYALSPQAKGKIERPYRWLQDRIVRTCAIEHITGIDQARQVLKHEVNRYNNHQVHSTTKEIPAMRFEKARKEGNSMFRPFSIPKPFLSSKDIFCLREKRMVNAYHKISLWNHEIFVPKAPLRDYVEIFIAPDKTKGIVE
jgi:predicted DNA-binding ArsR family transcriptional regulator